MARETNKISTFGKQAALARLVGLSPNHLCACLSGARNAGLTAGLNLGWHTKTDPRVWGSGGSPEARRAAVEAWAAAQESATRKPCRPGRFGIGRPGEQNGPSDQGDHSAALPGEPEPAGAF